MADGKMVQHRHKGFWGNIVERQAGGDLWVVESATGKLLKDWWFNWVPYNGPVFKSKEGETFPVIGEEAVYLVWNPRKGPPSVWHYSETSARQEAERLSQKHPGEDFHVLFVVDTARSEKITRSYWKSGK